jgi:hypothetical protein
VLTLAVLLDSVHRAMEPADAGQPPNQRLKLTARGGRLVGNESVLSAAAAGRTLSAIR